MVEEENSPPAQEHPAPSRKEKKASFSPKRASVLNLAETAISFRNIVDVRDRRKSLVKHKMCFVGKDAVDSMVYSGLSATREEAVQIGRSMVNDMHLFKTVQGDFEFDDDERFYRFIDLDDHWSSSDDEDTSRHPSIVEEEEDEEEVDLAKKSIAFRETVLTNDRTYRMKTYRDVFIGKFRNFAYISRVVAGLRTHQLSSHFNIRIKVPKP